MKPAMVPPQSNGVIQLPQTCGVHGSQLFLEFVDLVTQPRGELEVQLGGCVVHLVLQLLDEQSEVVAWQARELSCVSTRGA
jgi:hypothetical protein